MTVHLVFPARLAFAGASLGLVASIGLIVGANAATSAQDLQTSLVPGYPDVVGEYMQIAGAAAIDTPSAFNTATFLRLRAAADGERPKLVNAVIVAMPGLASTPNHWLYLGAQLVHKASERQCPAGTELTPCRLEVWIVQHRGANLADTQGVLTARAQGDPNAAIDYYFGRSILKFDPGRPNKWPALLPAALVGKAESTWRPLSQSDVPFIADWGFETHAGDLDRLLALIHEQSGAKNIFLSGHGEGGDFILSYAGRLQADNKRGYQKLSGLIFLDSDRTVGKLQTPTPTQIAEYFDRVDKLRKGQAKVYTDEHSVRGDMSGPAASALTAIVSAHYELSGPDAESIFPAPGIRYTASSPAGDEFLSALRLNYRALSGMSFDFDPLPGRGVLQVRFVAYRGANLGRLDFTPTPGSSNRCDLKSSPPPCVPSVGQLDPTRIYGWLDDAGEIGKAQLWLQAQAYAPARSNIKAITHMFAASGKKTLDASNLVAANWYAPARYDSDLTFLARFKTVKVRERGVNIDIDNGALIGVPIYVAGQRSMDALSNPFPLIKDFTELNQTGIYQTNAARVVAPLDSRIHTKNYRRADFIAADDALADRVLPGEPGASAVANTLVDWVLKHSAGRAQLPTPQQLGVATIY